MFCDRCGASVDTDLNPPGWPSLLRRQRLLLCRLPAGRGIRPQCRTSGLKESTLADWVEEKDNEAVAVGEAPLTPAERTRIRELEADVRRLNMENAFLKKASAYSRARTCEISFMARWRKSSGSCSRSALSRRFHVRSWSDAAGIYGWKKRPVSAHDQKDAELAARIRYLHQERHETGPASSGSCGTCRRRGTSPPSGGCAAWRGPRACSACIPGRRRGRPCRTARQSAAWSTWWTASSPPRSRTSCGSAISPILDVFWFRVPGDAYRHVLE